VVEPKLECKSRNVEFNGKISTASDYSLGLSVKDLLTKGSKLDITGAQNEKDGSTIKIAPSYKSDFFSSQFGVGVPVSIAPPQKKSTKPTKINGELVLQYPDHLYWGVNVLVDMDSNKKKVKGELSLVMLMRTFKLQPEVHKIIMIIKHFGELHSSKIFPALSDGVLILMSRPLGHGPLLLKLLENTS